MEHFILETPGKVVMEKNCISKVGDILSTIIDKKNAIILTDPGVRDAGVLDPLVSGLTLSGWKYEIIDAIEKEPDIKNADEVIRASRNYPCRSL